MTRKIQVVLPPPPSRPVRFVCVPISNLKLRFVTNIMRVSASALRYRPSQWRIQSILKNNLSSAVPRVKNFINGVFEESKTDKWIELRNPATQELVCLVPQSTHEELKRAELGAAEAFKTWREVPIQQRQVCVVEPGIPLKNRHQLSCREFFSTSKH